LNIHQSAALVRWIAEQEGIAAETLGVKGKSGILRSMESRAAFLHNYTHHVVFYYTPKHACLYESGGNLVEHSGAQAAQTRQFPFAGSEQLTVMGKQLHVGDPSPDFCLDYLDLADLVVRTISLADSTGLVRLLSVVSSLERPICQSVTHRWEALCVDLPTDACIYTVSMDSPQMQARWQYAEGVLHQVLSAQRSEQFGQDYGVWLKQWRQLQRSVFVIDRNDRIVYVEYIADQLGEPDYVGARQAVQQTIVE
jgi:thioredoxin-dependent peroxiredoxin